MKAILMAGGEGTRLRPLTVSRPKPMMPVCNRPIMEYVIELLKRYGIDTVIVTLHYLAEDIVSYFGDGSDFGIKIIYSVEDEPLGTAGSVKKVEEYLDDTFLVISGDAFTDLDLGKVIAFHHQRKATATLTLTKVENPLEYGVVITDDDNNILRFLEKPSWGEVFSDQVNTGIYVLEPEIFELMESGKSYDFSRDIFPKLLADKKPLFGYVASGYWCDIGDIEQYRKAHRDMFSGKVLHEMIGTQREPGVWIGEGTKVDPTVKLEGPIMIGRNCRVKAGVKLGRYTAIGDNCIVDEDSSLHRDILFNNVFFGRKSRSSGSIISRQSVVKAGVTISDGVVLGENVYVGQGALIFPQIKVWPEKHIEDGASISSNVVWGTLASGSLFGQDGVTGLANIEITPEFAMKLGASFGTMMPKNSSVIVSRDAHPATRLTNRALITGFCSVGVNVIDLRMIPAPITRYLISKTGAAAGIQTRVYSEDLRCFEMQFFNDQGINISNPTQRKIGNSFSRQDFRRTYMDEVGIISYLDDVEEQYAQGFIDHVDRQLIQKSNFKIVIDYSFGNASLFLPKILTKLGVETVSLNAYIDIVKAKDAHNHKENSLKQLSGIVGPLGANLGVLIDVNTEHISLVDEKGQILDGDTLLGLMTTVAMRSVKDALIAVPLYVPHTLEKLAETFGGKIIRTKTDSRSLMTTAALGQNRIAFAGTSDGAFIFPTFSPGFDAMYSLAQLLMMIAQENKPISVLCNDLPKAYTEHCNIDCSWSCKAKVMRLLVEQHRDRPLEMLDGVKISLKDGTVLVIPHPTLACLKVWVDAKSEARAKELMDSCFETIARLEKTDENATYRPRRAGNQPLGVSEVLPEERAFHFWIPGRYLGIQARSLRTFIDVIHYVETKSLEYHMSRDDFSTWIDDEVGRPLISDQIRCIARANCKGEELRAKLLDCFGEGGQQ